VPFNIYDGSSWNPLKKLKIHDGSAWQDATAIYVFDGTEWKKTGSKPTNTVLPSFTTDSRDLTVYSLEPGKTLTLVQGTWTDMNGPSASWAYEWQKRKIGTSSWETISGQTGLTLLLNEDLWPTQLKYVGYQIRCKVTATNQFGPNDPATPIYTPETGFILPASLNSVSATVTSNDIVEFTWQKPIGANDFYVQYQGPDVALIEISSLVSNTDASKGVYTSTSTSGKLVIDLGSADGTLGALFNPKFTEGSYSLTGYGTNANVSDLKIAKASVTSSKSNISTTGFTFNWQLNNGITPTSWTIYDGDSIVDTSLMNGVSSTSYAVSKTVTGGTTYGDYWIKVYGSAPRHKATNWESTPRLSVTAPQVAVPVNTAAPVISGGGRVFTSTTGTWTNTGSVYYYIYNWYSNGSLISIPSDSTLNLGTTTEYDNSTITCKVYCLLTDLNSTPESPSSNPLTASPYIPQYAAYVTCNGTSYSGGYGSAPTGAGITNITGNVTSNTLTSSQIVSALGIPSACIPPANQRIYYAYCTTSDTVANTSSTAYASCSSAYTALNNAGDIKSGWSCFTNSGSVVVPTCTIPTTTWYCTTSSPGAGVGVCGYTTSSTNTSGSGSGYSTSCSTVDYPACQSTDPAPVQEWFCTESYPGGGIGNCGYTKPGYDNTGSGSGYTRTCLRGTDYPACQSTAAPSITFYTGTSTCNALSGVYGDSPSASGPSTSSSMPSDTLTGGSTARVKTVYRSTQSAAQSDAAQAACAPVSFAPPAFFAPPGFFAPPTFFAPPGFFAPPVFFAPPGFFAPPVFFAPPGFFAPPKFSCIDQDTIIMKKVNGEIVPTAMKDIQVGDTVVGVNWDELTSEVEQDPTTWFATEMSNAAIIDTQVVGIIPSHKDVTMYFNGDISKRFSLEHTVLVKRDGTYMFIATGSIEIGDTIVEVESDFTLIERPVLSIETIDEPRTVYQIDAAPTDVIIAGNIVVHNGKTND
jgi:hypothetical protein